MKPGKALRKTKLPNVNLLLGDNGSGKTSVLRANAASAFGTAAKDLLSDSSAVRFGQDMGKVMATLKLHRQDVKIEQTGQMNLTLPHDNSDACLFGTVGDEHFVFVLDAERRKSNFHKLRCRHH